MALHIIPDVPFKYRLPPKPPSLDYPWPTKIMDEEVMKRWKHGTSCHKSHLLASTKSVEIHRFCYNFRYKSYRCSTLIGYKRCKIAIPARNTCGSRVVPWKGVPRSGGRLQCATQHYNRVCNRAWTVTWNRCSSDHWVKKKIRHRLNRLTQIITD